MKYEVLFSPEAEQQLLDLYEFVANKASPVTAERFVSAVINHCEELRNFPLRGTARDDIRPGLRTTNYKGRTAIAFGVDDDAETVSVIGIFYGGQDYEAALGTP